MSTIHINPSSRSSIVSNCSEVFFDDFFSKKAICKNNANGYIQSTSDGFSTCSFTGKEKDEETGYGYFGARYMDHELMTMWLSVDPMANKYPSLSPYNYCAWNPVKLVDPDGRDGVPVVNKNNKTIAVEVELIFFMSNCGHTGKGAINQWTKKLVSDINKEWNSREWTYNYNGEQYKVQFDFSYRFDNTIHGQDDFKFDKTNNKKNYIELLSQSVYQYDSKTGKSIYTHRSNVRGKKTGQWYHDTEAAAHEVGHLLHLPDRYYEDIQSESGYSVEPGWQGSIMAEPGRNGHVTQRDVKEAIDKMLKPNKQ